MGLHKLSSFECYWNDNIFYNNIVSILFTNNYYCLLSKRLLFPEKESFDFENDAIDNDNDPRHKINFFIEKLNQNFKNITNLEKIYQLTNH